MSLFKAGSISLPLPCCLSPTPAGAFYAVQSATDEPVRRYLLFLLSQTQTPFFAEEHLRYLHENNETAMQILFRMQELGYIQSLQQPQHAQQGQLEDILPPLLASVADSSKVILADEQGFYLSMSGFVHENAEELSALSAGLHEVYARYQALLCNNVGVRASAFALVDAAGNSEIGFWPLFFPRTRFSLIMAGMPRFNCRDFTRIVNCLAIRYSH